MTNRLIISADVGGSHITAAAFEEKQDGYYLRSSIRKNVDSTLSKDFILGEWVSLFSELNSDFSKACIILAMPAPFDYVNGICLIKDQGKFIHLFGIDLKQELAGRLGVMNSQIHFVNDAKAFLMGEANFGQVSAFKNILGLTLGTGLGSALKIGGQIFDAALWSSKFKDGIAEDYLGTAWFINWVKENLSLQVIGVKEIAENEVLIKKAIPAFSEFSKNLAQFILLQLENSQIEAIVLGGNISKAGRLFLEETISILMDNQKNIPVFISDFGDMSALFGAASHFFGQKVLLGLDQES
ncbi:ROK family protein [Aquiflexum sp. TKW24L]|uniref:ROK family protein n=1 Tax=Aquiflexum sp. TKW24L TaxID=2942212 RepID=UPI0020BFB018|nr:ROK family protein [Aquiflexum sp. TKW24L]MCL6258287.1 ROK family protein [Aquiflexum sp. TKW24L]